MDPPPTRSPRTRCGKIGSRVEDRGNQIMAPAPSVRGKHLRSCPLLRNLSKLLSSPGPSCGSCGGEAVLLSFLGPRQRLLFPRRRLGLSLRRGGLPVPLLDRYRIRPRPLFKLSLPVLHRPRVARGACECLCPWICACKSCRSSGKVTLNFLLGRGEAVMSCHPVSIPESGSPRNGRKT